MRVIIFSAVLGMLLNSVLSQKWAHHAVLDGLGRCNLYWNPPQDIRGDQEITFKVVLKAKGYIGLGFSPNGGMPGSDIVTGWIKDGKVYFQDRHADSNSLPSKDDQQDYVLIDAYENETSTVFEFRRKLDTCDPNDWVIDKNTARVIYAYSEDDPESEDPFYHRENRGSKSIILLQYSIQKDPDLNLTSLLKWDLKSPGVDFSSTTSLYWCKIFKTPDVSEKHHIVYLEHQIEEGNEPFVHHITVHECVGGTSEEYEKFLGDRGHECYQPNMPEKMFRCQGVMALWAIGGNEIIYPEHVGLPIDPDRATYCMLEIHYDNPQKLSGKIDHSGYRFHYTRELRKYDLGANAFSASFTPRVFIPPRRDKYVVAGHGNPECFTSQLPDSGANVIAIFLHTHSIAREIKVRLFRGNEELKPLYDDTHYDYNYQPYRFYTKEVKLLKNDQLTVECTYNSSQRNSTTFGGLTISQEMCFAMIMYYPSLGGRISFTGPSLATINKSLNTNITKDEDIVNVLETYDWESIDTDEVENAMRYSQQETYCSVGFSQNDQEKSVISYPNDLIPYKKQSICNGTD